MTEYVVGPEPDDAWVVTCAVCGRDIEPEYEDCEKLMLADGEDHYLCPSCAETGDYDECIRCGTYLDHELAKKDKASGETLCEYCYDDMYG